MKTTYPHISILLIALIITSAVHAQQREMDVIAEQSLTTYSSNQATAGQAIRIVGRNDQKVVLTWAPFKGAVSHYTLERSFDARVFHEACVFFTGDWNEEPDYVYHDKLKSSYAGPLYYRLKVTGLDGTEVYTSVSVAQGNRSLVMKN
jgi:hypothetical protein